MLSIIIEGENLESWEKWKQNRGGRAGLFNLSRKMFKTLNTEDVRLIAQFRSVSKKVQKLFIINCK